MKQRSVLGGIVLWVITCGLYGWYWHYVTTAELRDATGREDLTPGLDLMLGLITCGLWFIYTDYRNAQAIYELMSRTRLPSVDRSQMILLIGLCRLVGVAIPSAFICFLVLQDDYNSFARNRGSLMQAPTPATREQ